MSIRAERPCVNLATLDVFAAEARQATELLTGAVALTRQNPSSALYQLISQARAATAKLLDAIENTVAVEYELQRNETARLQQGAAKHVGGAEGGGR